MVERHLAKVAVEGSSPFTRFFLLVDSSFRAFSVKPSALERRGRRHHLRPRRLDRRFGRGIGGKKAFLAGEVLLLQLELRLSKRARSVLRRAVRRRRSVVANVNVAVRYDSGLTRAVYRKLRLQLRR